MVVDDSVHVVDDVWFDVNVVVGVDDVDAVFNVGVDVDFDVLMILLLMLLL